MARRRKSAPKTIQGRDLALAIRQGERRGLKQAEIAATLGINPRTVRKIKAGETSGTKTYARLTKRPSKPTATPNAFNAEFVVGYDASGNPVIGSANIIVPDVRTRTGERRAPTALDVFRIRNLQEVLDAERARLQRQYNISALRRASIDDDCRRTYCGHPGGDHYEDEDDPTLAPCSRCECPDFQEPPPTARLRSITTMRKPATAILRTGL